MFETFIVFKVNKRMATTIDYCNGISISMIIEDMNIDSIASEGYGTRHFIWNNTFV